MTTFVHHDGALGDVLLSLPCLRLLQAEGETIHFAGRPDAGRLLRDSGIVLDVSDAGGRLYAGFSAGNAETELSAFLARFTRAVVFTVDGTGPVATGLRRAISGTQVVLTIPPPGARISAARYRFGQLSSDVFPEPSGALLPVPQLQRGIAEAMLSRWGWRGDRPLVMVHPGSGSRGKRWPLERFLAAVTALLEGDAFVVLFTGPAEDDLFLDRVEGYCRGHERAVHLGDADLMALAALLERCGAYLGNDSGVSHLAAAAGAPTVVLFGPTDPVVWGPVGRCVTVIAEESLDAVSVERVVAAVRGELARARKE